MNNLITNPLYSNLPGNFYHTLKQATHNNEVNQTVTHTACKFTHTESMFLLFLMTSLVLFFSYIIWKDLREL